MGNASLLKKNANLQCKTCKFAFFAVSLQTILKKLRNKPINLNNMEQNEKWKKVRKVLINKYAITLYVFAVLFLFVGEQSWISQISRKREIRKVEQKISDVEQETAASLSLLQSLEQPDSLERFAREQYNMHKDNEVVFLVE